MSIVIIFQQMLVLFFMITTGFICYKKNFVNEIGNKNISAIIVNILNPLLIISGVLNKEIRYSSKMIRENILLVSILFLILIVISWIYTRFMNVPLREKNSY